MQTWSQSQVVAVIVLAFHVFRPSSACTVFELHSAGFVANFIHLIPAVALFADNGTFYVRPPLCTGFTLLMLTCKVLGLNGETALRWTAQPSHVRIFAHPAHTASGRLYIVSSRMRCADRCTEDGGFFEWFRSNATVRCGCIHAVQVHESGN